jgi:uncharacterized phage-associated protein
MSANALHVARYLVKLAAGESEPEHLTHMRLQKLLYYVQGWSLAATGERFFDGEIQAWTHGPVACWSPSTPVAISSARTTGAGS